MFDIHLTHEQQQKAVEQIQQLMAQGISSGEAIQIVAKALREILYFEQRHGIAYLKE